MQAASFLCTGNSSEVRLHFQVEGEDGEWGLTELCKGSSFLGGRTKCLF